MVKHCVFIQFSSDAPEDQISQIFRELAKLQTVCPGLLDFACGPNSSPEDLNKEFTHAFVMTFDTPANRDAYLDHPDHKAAAGLLGPHLKSGRESVIVMDFEV